MAGINRFSADLSGSRGQCIVPWLEHFGRDLLRCMNSVGFTPAEVISGPCDEQVMAVDFDRSSVPVTDEYQVQTSIQEQEGAA